MALVSRTVWCNRGMLHKGPRIPTPLHRIPPTLSLTAHSARARVATPSPMVACPASDDESQTKTMVDTQDQAANDVGKGPAECPVIVDVDETAVHLNHSILHTTFVGVQHHASKATAIVHQFRGIKYATVPTRFRRSVLLEKYPSQTNATRHGAICPQIKNHWMETRLYGLPPEIVPKQEYSPPEDEWECLNLCVTTPAEEYRRMHAPLPVMVWIHGGGNVTGSGTEWIWDAGALVRKSIQCGKPVVVVSINFRLGVFGFGASERLREDNDTAGEEGVGNYGLHDQRTAFTWIRKYISGFGGDPENVTLFGSSWGAADIHAHLLSSPNQAEVLGRVSGGPLFHRAILQSGALVPSSSVVQEVHTAGNHLSRMMQQLQVKTIDELREVPAEKLVALQGERVRPVDDGIFLRRDWKSLALPFATAPMENDGKRVYRQDVMIGDVACESVLWAIPAKLWGADAVARRARAIVQSVRRADALMRAYDIVDSEKGQSNPGSPKSRRRLLKHDTPFEDSGDEECSDSDDDFELAERVMDLINDVAFAWPVDVAARSAADSAYIFDEPSPSPQPSPSPEPMSDEQTSANGYAMVIDENSMLTVPTTFTPQTQRLPNAPFVYRYVFDQASPYTQTPHHGVDLLYLFGNIPFPEDPDLTVDENEEVNWERVKVRNEMQERWLSFAYGEEPWPPLTPQPPAGTDKPDSAFPTPMLSPSSSFSYGSGASVKSVLGGSLTSSNGGSYPSTVSDSSRSSSFSHAGSLYLDAFPAADPASRSFAAAAPFLSLAPHKANAHGHMHQHHRHHHHAGRWAPTPSPNRLSPAPPANAHQPVSISEADKVFVFGPEGETGARSAKIFAGRRRVHAWREALAPLGLATAQKVGQELGNGPPINGGR